MPGTGTIAQSCLTGPSAEEQTKQLTEGWSYLAEYEPKWWPRLCHYHRMTMIPVETPVAQIQLLEQGHQPQKVCRAERRKDEWVKRLRLPGLYR